MREILFRGKQNEGKWVEGVYFKHDTVKVCFSNDDPKPRHLIIQDGFCDWGFEPPIHCVDVDPTTVGQYTGLTDKNGTKIFEGDIVEGADFTAEDGGYGVVSFVDGAFEVSGNNVAGTFNENYYGREFEVIGNIHDNPELLEEAKNEAD